MYKFLAGIAQANQTLQSLGKYLILLLTFQGQGDPHFQGLVTKFDILHFKSMLVPVKKSDCNIWHSLLKFRMSHMAQLQKHKAEIPNPHNAKNCPCAG